jgi:predicted phage terminase large subunit-like protein
VAEAWLSNLAARYDASAAPIAAGVRDRVPATAAEPGLSPASLALATSPGYLLPAHLDLLDRTLVRVVESGGRLVVAMPPRHGKSLLTSKFLPAWFLARWPRRRVVLASYEADYAAGWGRQARDLLELHGRRLFDVKVRQDTSAAARWEIAGHGGGMVTAGIGGALTGRGADLLIVDDPLKNPEEAASATRREAVWNWFAQVASTRLEPGAAVVVVMTRWHVDDLAGRLVDGDELDRWEVLELPALADEGDVLGRAPGEALWPQRFGVEALAEQRRVLGSQPFSALYQQRPVPAEGAIFKREWIRYFVPRQGGYDLGGRFEGEEFVRRFQTVDLAVSTKSTADWTVIATWGVTSRKELLLLDVVRRRMEGPEIVPALRAGFERWKPTSIGVEQVAFQLSIVQAAQRDGLPVVALRPDKDKVSRAMTAAARMESAQVFFPRDAVWLGEFERELLQFPAGKHDDQVDTLSYAAAQVVLGRWAAGGSSGEGAGVVVKYDGMPDADVFATPGTYAHAVQLIDRDPGSGFGGTGGAGW